MSHAHGVPKPFTVELPGGGELALETQAEVDLWEESMQRYIDDYQLVQQNDKILVGAILSQQLLMFRAQQKITGMAPEYNAAGQPTGNYVRVQLKATEMAAAQATLIKAADQIRAIEVSLGIDKKTREAGGTHTVQNYVLTLKRKSREYGLHLSERMLAYEDFQMGLRWRVRVLRNADAEDRNYHGITAEAICEWAFDELTKLEVIDQTFAKSKQALYSGQV